MKIGEITALLLVLCLMISMLSGCGSARKSTRKNEPQRPGPTKIAEKSRTERKAPRIEPASIPPTPREMRAVWIATVANIDWPSKAGLPVARQKEELRAMMDRAKLLHMNAIFLQVRPRGRRSL